MNQCRKVNKPEDGKGGPNGMYKVMAMLNKGSNN